MSTVRLLKDRTVMDGPKAVVQKAGTTISVPFAVGRQMVQAKEAEYPAAAAVPSAAAARDDLAARQLGRLKSENERLTTENLDLAAEVAELRGLLAAATEPPAQTAGDKK